jgi:hypothetical protein
MKFLICCEKALVESVKINAAGTSQDQLEFVKRIQLSLYLIKASFLEESSMQIFLVLFFFITQATFQVCS